MNFRGTHSIGARGVSFPIVGHAILPKHAFLLQPYSSPETAPERAEGKKGRRHFQTLLHLRVTPPPTLGFPQANLHY